MSSSPLVCIKRKLTDDPAENVVFKAKRPRSGDVFTTVLKRVGTQQSKEEPLQPDIIKNINKIFKRHLEDGNEGPKPKALRPHVQEVASVEGRKEEPMESVTDAAAEAAKEYTFVEANLHNKSEEEEITCNGVPMEKVEYVYDVYYAGGNEIRNALENEDFELSPLVHENEISDDETDEEDENAEDNPANDYPDESDFSSGQEDWDEEDYLTEEIKKSRWRSRNCYDDDDASYGSHCDDDDDDCDFDEDGTLFAEGLSTNPVMRLQKLLAATHMDNSNSDSE